MKEAVLLPVINPPVKRVIKRHLDLSNCNVDGRNVWAGLRAPYRIIVGFEQKRSKRGSKGSRKTRNHCSERYPHPGPWPPKPPLLAQNGHKSQEVARLSAISNSETGGGERPLGGREATFLTITVFSPPFLPFSARMSPLFTVIPGLWGQGLGLSTNSETGLRSPRGLRL